MPKLSRWTTGHAVDLAIFRITVMTVVLGAAEVHQASQFAQLPPLLRTPPWGFAWAAALLPDSPESVEKLQWILLVAATCSLIGLFTRLALFVTTSLLLVVLAMSQQWGAGVHTHHLLWFSALLAASPCGDALSVDAWRRQRKGLARPGLSVAYGLPIRIAWLSIGLIFFFPGVWKWQAQGLGWALSDNLLNQMRFKWLQYHQLPALRLDQYPLLLKAGGIGVLLLETSLLPLLLLRKTRTVAVILLFLFHATTRMFFFISFSSLWACYTVFLPWSRWLHSPVGSHFPQKRWPGVAVGMIVLGGQLSAGTLAIEHGWPFACYPTFRFNPGGFAPILIAEEELHDGLRKELPLTFLEGTSGQREWSEMWHLLRAPEPRRLQEWWRAHRRENSGEVKRVHFFRGSISVDPNAWSAPARRSGFLVTVEADF